MQLVERQGEEKWAGFLSVVPGPFSRCKTKFQPLKFQALPKNKCP